MQPHTDTQHDAMDVPFLRIADPGRVSVFRVTRVIPDDVPQASEAHPKPSGFRGLQAASVQP